MADIEPGRMTIGEVARRSGVPATTLRYYEDIGLLPAPGREGGCRRYDGRVLRRLALVDTAKRAGFSLLEVRELLEGFDSSVPATERWRLLASRKLPEVEHLLERATAMKRLLERGLICRRLRLPCGTGLAGGSASESPSPEDRAAGGHRGGPYPSPFAAARGPGLVHADLVFDTLVWKDATGALIPWLARHWEASADRLEWRFILRPGARWHDGRPVTAADVAFSFEYLTRGPGAGRAEIQARGLDAVETVRVEGETVVFGLRRRYVAFEEWVAGRMLVTPAHIWSRIDDPATARHADAVMGSGPYRLESHTAATGASVYGAYDDHVIGRPYVRLLEFVPTTNALAGLRRGSIDVAAVGGEEAIAGEDLDTFDAGNYGSISAPGEWTRALHFNLARGFPFDDRAFRHAVAHAIDRDALVRQVLAGRGTPGSTGGMAPSHPGLAKGLPRYRYDPGRARAMLDEIGIADRDGDGRRELPDGERLRIGLLTSPSGSATAARLVARDLAAVGLDTRIKTLPPTEADEAAAAGRYDLALIGYGGLGGDPDWLRHRLSSRVEAPTRAKARGYGNARFDELADRQQGIAEPLERRALVREMQRIAAEDLPVLHLYVPNRLVYFDRQVFDAWYFTPGGVWGAYPGALNKHALVTGRRRGV